MRLLNAESSLLIGLAFALTLTLAGAIPLVSRSLVCGNDGTTKAGTKYFPRRSLPTPSHSSASINPPPRLSRTLSPRAIPVVWCAHRTNTYVIITYVSSLPSVWVQPILRSAYSYILDQIYEHGDDLVPGGTFEFPKTQVPFARPFGVDSFNANNHQQTWGVLAAAIDAIDDWMNRSGKYGEATFRIFDGENEVGAGRVGWD